MGNNSFYAYGMALRTLREKAGKTLEESARQCGHTRMWLSNIERGTKRIYFEDAKILVDYYGYTLSYLAELVDIFER